MDSYPAEPGVSASQNEISDVIRNYNLWRNIANFVGKGPYDPAEWEDGRLYFRADYSAKVQMWPEWAESGYWGAWIIAPSPEGFRVIRSLLHERETHRSETLEVVFSRFSDAGKYIILHMGDGVRCDRDIRLKTLKVNWEERGLDARIRVEPAGSAATKFLTSDWTSLGQDYANKHLKAYTLEADPGVHGFALDYDQPSMEVLALSFEELTEKLLDGMPDSITSQVARWRD